MTGSEARPVLRIVRGDATAEEIAALTALLVRAPAAVAKPVAVRPRAGGWGDPALRLRPALRLGSWRSSL
jgi:hypothetical protein